jgi:hypothetical protein
VPHQRADSLIDAGRTKEAFAGKVVVTRHPTTTLDAIEKTIAPVCGRAQSKPDINQPTISAESVENDPSETWTVWIFCSAN